MNSTNATPHKRVQHSTTLNRKYVKRPTKAPKIRTTAELHAENLKRRQALATRMNRERLIKAPTTKKSLKTNIIIRGQFTEKIERHPLETSTRARQVKPPVEKKNLSMKEKKDQAIAAALKQMEKSSTDSEPKKLHKSFLSLNRVALALCLAILVVGAAIYFVNLSIPSLSVKVVAMQTGIDASYPSYTLKGFALKEVKTEDQKIYLRFSSDSNTSYIITEEKSSWNSSALEANYIKPTYDRDYTVIREQGLTIFVANKTCLWVNGGKLFTISTDADLTKTQLISIATSL